MFKIRFTILLVCSIFLLVGCAGGKDCNSTTPKFDKDPNNLNGDVNIVIDKQNHDKGPFHVIVLLDGKRQGELFLYEEDPCNLETYGAVLMRTQFFANGPHTVSTISKDSTLKVICQSQVKVVFNNELSSITIDKGYWLGKDFHFSAISSSQSASYIVEVNDFSTKSIVYSRNFTGNINAVIPSEVFAEDSQIYYLIVRDSSGNIKLKELVGRDYDEEGFKEDDEAK